LKPRNEFSILDQIEMTAEANINEWEFTARLAGWISAIFESDKTLTFELAQCERKSYNMIEARK